MGFSTYTMATKGTSKEHKLKIKLKMVRYAQENRIKPTAEKFGISRNTLRKWLRAYESKGVRGLVDQRKGPKHIAHKTSQDIEDLVIAIRTQTGYGARSIKYFFDVGCGVSAIQRIIKQKKLTRKRRKRHQKKRDLRDIKALYKGLTHLQYDVKHLRDISNYWIQMQLMGLPKYQYTARDPKTGWVFLGYSDELSELNARTMIQCVIFRMIDSLSLMPSEIHIQTDNGAEFSGLSRSIKTSSFVRAIIKEMGANHSYIPPGCCNANADVESFHNTIEQEFFDRVQVSSREDFLRKAETYRVWYNLVRPNFSKKVRTPLEIVDSEYPSEIAQAKLTCISTIDLDKIAHFQPSNKGGQSLPNLPDEC